MLRSIAAFTVVLWLLGIAIGYTMGGWIHLFPAAAVIAALIDTIKQRMSTGKKRHKTIKNNV